MCVCGSAGLPRGPRVYSDFTGTKSDGFSLEITGTDLSLELLHMIPETGNFIVDTVHHAAKSDAESRPAESRSAGGHWHFVLADYMKVLASVVSVARSL